MIINVYWSSCNYPLSCHVSTKPKFLWIFSKNTQVSNLMKILLVGAELFRADGRKDRQTDRRTDIKVLIVAFRNFANAPSSRMLIVCKDSVRTLQRTKWLSVRKNTRKLQYYCEYCREHIKGPLAYGRVSLVLNLVVQVLTMRQWEVNCRSQCFVINIHYGAWFLQNWI